MANGCRTTGRKLVQAVTEEKMYILVAALGLIVGASIFMNLRVLYYFTDTFNAVMSDNLSCHRFQEALSVEAEAFAAAIDDRSQENLEEYEAACQNTASLLGQLPYDYGKIGENRYAITWNIRNSYGAYEQKRDQVFSMGPGKPEYIYQLYEVYDMQDYLSAYASRLTQAVLLEGNAYYEEQLPKLTTLPYIFGAIGWRCFWPSCFLWVSLQREWWPPWVSWRRCPAALRKMTSARRM